MAVRAVDIHSDAAAIPVLSGQSGNLGKTRTLFRLEELVSSNPGARILDIGCAGPHPMMFWRGFLHRHPDARLTGIDVAGIEECRRATESDRFRNLVLRELSAYAVGESFAPESFDVVIATQVLEHIARPASFLANVSRVLAPGGRAFWVFDSAYRGGKYSVRHPVVCAKKLAKRLLAATRLDESHYDIPLYDWEIERLYADARLRVVDRRFYNIEPLKWLQNHQVEPNSRDEIMELWHRLEDALNDAGAATHSAGKSHFCGIYYELIKED